MSTIHGNMSLPIWTPMRSNIYSMRKINKRELLDRPRQIGA